MNYYSSLRAAWLSHAAVVCLSLITVQSTAAAAGSGENNMWVGSRAAFWKWPRILLLLPPLFPPL